MKKIKNPDQYIKRLKAKVKRLSRQVEFRDKGLNKLRDDNGILRNSAFGSEWFAWHSPQRLGVEFTNKQAVKRARIGATVVAVGEIVDFKQSKNEENTAHMDFKTVYIKE